MARNRQITEIARLLRELRGNEHLPPDLVEAIEPVLVERLERLRREAGPPPLPEWARKRPTPAPTLRPAPPPPPAPRPKKKREGPTLWDRLGPVFAENILFALAAFLIVAGAVFFVTTAWTTMSGTEKLLVVAGGLVLLGAILYAAGRLANKGGALPEAERVLTAVVAYLVPVAAVPAGLLLYRDVPYGLLAAGVILGSGWFAVRSAARIAEPALSPFLPHAVTGLAALVVAAPWIAAWPVAAATLGAGLLLALTTRAGRRVVPLVGPSLTPVFWSLLLLVFSVAVLVGDVGILSRALSELGIVVAAAGAAVVVLTSALERAERLPGGRGETLLISALTLAVAGTVMALGNERALLVAAGFGAFAAIAAGLKQKTPWLLLPGLVLAALAYLKLPAPIREAALQLRDSAARELGYEPKKLPLAWYGVSFIPYVAASGLAAGWILRRGLIAHARVALLWTLVTSGGLVALALTLHGGDLRAPATVLLAQGALLLALAPAARSRWAAFAGALEVYAGAAYLLLHLEALGVVQVLTLTGLGLAGIGFALRFRTRGVLDATGVMALAVFAASALGEMAGSLGTPGWLDLPAFGLLAVLLVLLGVAYRFPAGGLLASLALYRFVTGSVTVAGLEGWHMPAFAAASALPLVAMRIFRNRDFLAAGVLALQFLGAVTHFLAFPEAPWTWQLAVGLLAGALVLTIAAVRAGRGWVAQAALLEAVLAAVALAAVCPAPWGPAAFALVSAALAVSCFLLRAETGVFRMPLARTVTVLAPLCLLWSLTFVVEVLHRAGPDREGAFLAVGALFVAAGVRFAWGQLKRMLPDDARFAGVAATLSIGVVAAGCCDFFDARADLYPLALIAAAAAAQGWVGREEILRPASRVLLFAALGSAVAVSLAGEGEPAGLLAAFLLIAAAGWAGARSTPVLGGTLLLLSLLGAVSLAGADRLLSIAPDWQASILLFFAAAAILAPRVGVFRVRQDVADGVGYPVVAAGAVSLASFAVLVTLIEPNVLAVEVDRDAMALAALAFVAAASALSIRTGGMLRRIGPVIALLCAVFAFAPVNALIAARPTHYWRPDVAVGLLAALLAARLPRRSPAIASAYAVAAFSLLLTWGELRHLSTPLTFAAASLAPLVLLLRQRRPGHADLHGLALLATALAFTLYAVPDTGAPPAEILPLLAAVAATVLLLLGGVALRLRARRDRGWPREAARGYARSAATAGVFAILCLGANTALLSDLRAGSLGTALSVYAMAVVVAVSLLAATRFHRPALAHSAVAALVVLYAFLAVRTGILSLFADHHPHALLLMGMGLLLAARARGGRLTTPLTVDGLALTAPAVLVSLPAVMGADFYLPHATSALFLAAAAYGFAAFRLSSRLFGVLSVVLLNLAIFALWRRQGIVDPAFYGVPPGLTLLAGAEILKSRIGKGARLGLFVPGVALLYGSVGVQVLRVEEPLHALVLFGLGLATLCAGFAWRRNRLVVAGTAAVVLDVVAYLARHGFEEGFLGATLLVLAGLTVLAVATLAARRRRST